MKKKLIAILAAALALALCCGQALALTGDLVVEDVPAYADPDMQQFVAVIPAYTSVLVRSYDSFADVYVGGKLCYIDRSALLRKSIDAPFTATLKKGTRVYQQPTSSALSRKLKKSGTVKVCAVSGSWALVQTTGKQGAYAFVKINKLTNLNPA